MRPCYGSLVVTIWRREAEIRPQLIWTKVGSGMRWRGLEESFARLARFRWLSAGGAERFMQVQNRGLSAPIVGVSDHKCYLSAQQSLKVL
jgi:hypothetical protein